MSESSDDDIFAYQSLSKRSVRDDSGLSLTPSPRTSASKKKNSKQKGKTRKPGKKTPKNKIDFESESGTPDNVAGFCPMCQMPLSIVIGSSEHHVARCITELENVTFDGECPMGADCDVTIRHHYQRYSHNLLSQKRAGLSTDNGPSLRPDVALTKLPKRISLGHHSQKSAIDPNDSSSRPSANSCHFFTHTRTHLHDQSSELIAQSEGARMSPLYKPGRNHQRENVSDSDTPSPPKKPRNSARKSGDDVYAPIHDAVNTQRGLAKSGMDTEESIGESQSKLQLNGGLDQMGVRHSPFETKSGNSQSSTVEVRDDCSDDLEVIPLPDYLDDMFPDPDTDISEKFDVDDEVSSNSDEPHFDVLQRVTDGNSQVETASEEGRRMSQPRLYEVDDCQDGPGEEVTVIDSNGGLTPCSQNDTIPGHALTPLSAVSRESTVSPSLFPDGDLPDVEVIGYQDDRDPVGGDKKQTSTPISCINEDHTLSQSSVGSLTSANRTPPSLSTPQSDRLGESAEQTSWGTIFKKGRGTVFSSTDENIPQPPKNSSGFHSSSAGSRKGSSMWSANPKRQCPFYKKMPGTTLTVDAFSYGEVPGITGYFLTHFHADHYGGLKKTFTNPIYCSIITANLVKSKLNVPSKYVYPLAMEREHTVEGVKVTLLDANHCPGSVLILFSLPNGQRYLHTGDFRAHTRMESYPQLQDCRIRRLYLDTTYLDPRYDFPKQDDVIQYAVDLAVKAVQENPKILVMCGTYTIGKERVFRAIANALGCKICVETEKKRILSCFDDPDLMRQIVTDKKSTRLHVVSMAKLVLKRLSLYLDEFQGRYDSIVAFKPTGWTHSAKSSSLADIKPSVWGRVKVYGIPYSEHSSYSEMKRFVQFIHSSGPVEIIPTVNVGKPQQREFMQSHFQEWLSEDYKPLPDPDTPSASQRSQASTHSSTGKRNNPSASQERNNPSASQERTLLSFFKKSSQSR